MTWLLRPTVLLASTLRCAEKLWLVTRSKIKELSSVLAQVKHPTWHDQHKLACMGGQSVTAKVLQVRFRCLSRLPLTWSSAAS